MTRRILCPAKINTFLSVGPPDQKGWHPLRTLFQAIELSDELVVHFGKGSPGVFCPWEGLPAENTLTKTLRLIEESASLPPLRIELTKNIPVQSGLGGGSSDAAGLLKVIRDVFPEALPDHFMKEVAFAVGADVPFFLVGGSAKGEGYGERLTPLTDPPKEWVVVAQPQARVSTPEAYRRLDSLPRDWADFEAAERGVNDFELAAPAECLSLKAQLSELGSRFSLLTGSGSAVFGLFGQEEERARTAWQKLRVNHPFAWVGQTLAREEC